MKNEGARRRDDVKAVARGREVRNVKRLDHMDTGKEGVAGERRGNEQGGRAQRL